jgi:hypothetical protein
MTTNIDCSWLKAHWTTKWLQVDHKWLQKWIDYKSNFKLTANWLTPDDYKWLQILTSSWLQADYKLTTNWLTTTNDNKYIIFDCIWIDIDWLQMYTNIDFKLTTVDCKFIELQNDFQVDHKWLQKIDWLQIWLQADCKWLQIKQPTTNDHIYWLQAGFKLTVDCWLQVDCKWIEIDWLQMSTNIDFKLTTSWLQADYKYWIDYKWLPMTDFKLPTNDYKFWL